MNLQYFGPEWRKRKRREEYLRLRSEGKTAMVAWRFAQRKYGEPDVERFLFSRMIEAPFHVIDPRRIVIYPQ